MLKKITIICLIGLIISIYLSNSTFAIDSIMQSAEGFVSGSVENDALNEGMLIDTSNYLYNILFTIAVVLSIAIGMVIGIQFIFGSVEEQAKVKETLVPYIIGVFVVFASFTIWKIAIDIGNKVAPIETTQIQQSETTGFGAGH